MWLATVFILWFVFFFFFKSFICINLWLDEQESRNQLIFFLVIYAPKRGLIEVWRMKHGGKEAVLNVGPGGHLLNTSSLFGAPSLPTRQVQDWSVSRCYLLSKDGRLQQIVINSVQPLTITSVPVAGDTATPNPNS